MERIMDKEKSYQMQVTYLTIDKVLFALFLVVNCFVCNNTCCAQTTIESYPKDFCLNKLSDLVKDKPFKEELVKYPFIAEESVLWVICIKKETCYNVYQGILFSDVYVKKDFPFSKPIDQMFDLLKNDSVMCEPIKTKSEYQYISSYIIINDNSIPEQSFYWNMYSTNKYEEHIHKINSMFLDLVTIPEIAKLL